jgi:Zn-dependent membrane protease YugP
MHPALVLTPIVAGTLGPRLWAGYLLRRHDQIEEGLPAADELARQLLDQHGLELVCVEATDVADHYDPIAKAVRLRRARYGRRSLTAATTAAHEVGHALQDASRIWPFRLHLALMRASRVASGVSVLLLIAVPAAAMIARRPSPLVFIVATTAGVFVTALVAQLAALPSELDASYRRALPMLRSIISGSQLRDARRILFACSLTYAAASINPLMVLLPWLGGPWWRPLPALRRDDCAAAVGRPRLVSERLHVGARPERMSADYSAVAKSKPCSDWVAAPRRLVPRRSQPALHYPAGLKALARPYVRAWLRLTGDY